MRFKKTTILFIISFILLNINIIFATNKNYNTSTNYFRIHIVANSDSIDDQLLKYTIAKKVDIFVNQITINSNSKEESKRIIQENIQNILNICNNILKDNNSNYNITAYLGKIKYDEKLSDNINMQAGIYDSLKIVIGNGNGQNWWSLIYPTTITDLDIQESFNKDTNFSLGIIDFIKKLFNKQQTNSNSTVGL